MFCYFEASLLLRVTLPPSVLPPTRCRDSAGAAATALAQRIGSHPVRLFVVCVKSGAASPAQPKRNTKRARSVSSYFSLFGPLEELTAILAGFPGILIDGCEEPCDRLTVFAYWLNSSGGDKVQAPEAFQMKLSFLCT